MFYCLRKSKNLHHLFMSSWGMKLQIKVESKSMRVTVNNTVLHLS